MSGLNCPKCRADIATKNISQANSLAKCEQCGTVFTTVNSAESQPALSRPQPPNVTIKESANYLRLQIRWYTHTDWITLIVGLSIILVFTPMVSGIIPYLLFNAEANPERVASAFLALFVATVWSIGPLSFYYGLVGLFNKTIIEVDRATITARHFPLPWKRAVNLSVTDVKQLYGDKEHVDGARRGRQFWLRGIFSLKVTAKNQRSKTLLPAQKNKVAVLYVEDKIEQFLGIKDNYLGYGLQKSQP